MTAKFSEVDLLLIKDFDNLSIAERKRAFYKKFDVDGYVPGIKIDPIYVLKGMKILSVINTLESLFTLENIDFKVVYIDWVNLKATIEWVSGAIPTDNFYLSIASIVDGKPEKGESKIINFLGFYLTPKINNDFVVSRDVPRDLSLNYQPNDPELL